MSAFDWLDENIAEPIREWVAPTPSFSSGGETGPTAPDVDPEAAINLDTEDDRFAAVDAYSQNYKLINAGDQVHGKDECAATSLMAAAMLAEGKGGVEILVDMVKNDEKMGKLNAQQLAENGVLDRLKDQEQNLTKEDLRSIQTMLHGSLRDQMSESERENLNGVTPEVLKNTIANNDRLREMMERNDMQLNAIDNNGAVDEHGNPKPDHVVLQIGEDGSEGMRIYDPGAKLNGGQIIDDPGALENYEKARHPMVGGMEIGP